MPEDSSMTFDRYQLQAQTLACLIRASIELAEDAPGFAQLVESTIAKAIAVARQQD